MKKRLHTEHILLTSLAAILLCVVALAGTTYAWFFASVGSTNNTIKTGSMELALLREDENGQYQELSPDALTNGALFSANADGNGANWTAGHVEVVYLGLQNKGTIDDIYNVVVNAESGVGDMLEGLVIPFASAQEAASLQQNLIACDTNSQRWELLTSAAAHSSAAIAQQSLTGAVTLLAGQPLLIVVFAYFVIFNLMGRDYDAAVIAAGVCGFGMGATPNAMANMQALCERYAPSVKAYLLIPLVGSLFADFLNSLVITFFINFL